MKLSIKHRCWAAVLTLAALLQGCAQIPALNMGATGAGPATGDAVVPVLTIEAPAALKRLLDEHLDVQQALARQAKPSVTSAAPAASAASAARADQVFTIGAVEWSRLLAAAPAQARDLAETEGYFQAQAHLERLPTPGHWRLRVDAGEPTRVTALDFRFEGDVQTQAQAGDAAAQAAQSTVRAIWPLNEGDVFRNALWRDAKNSALAKLRAQGWAAATWAQTRAEVDPDTQGARLVVVLSSGPRFFLGDIAIEGLALQPESTVRQWLALNAGEPYTEERLLDAQARLQKSGLFESVSVLLDPDPEQARTATVTVALHELPLQQALLGLGFSANTGARLSAEHTHRRVFGISATAHNKAEWGTLRQAWEGEISTHAGSDFYRYLLGGAVERLKASTDQVLAARLRAGRTQDTPRIERLFFVEWQRAQLRNSQGEADAHALSVNAHSTWRHLDSNLLPTEGFSLAGELALGHAQGRAEPDEADGSGMFSRLYTRATLYKPLGKTWYGQLRLEFGGVFTPRQVAVPDTMRFRAGGDDSVRGYAYRSLTPKDDQGNPRSGKVLGTVSLELARPVSLDLPSVWWAAFVDAGRAADHWRFKPAIGAGLGVRWRSPVGPVRVDLAYGNETRRLRLHFSVGVPL